MYRELMLGHRSGIAVTSCFFLNSVLAGPPLEIDDPGILDPGQWEIITAATMTSTNAGDVYEAPVLDVSYGVAEQVQVSAVYPYVFVDPDEGSAESDFGNLEIGVKWRFVDEDGLQLAVAPLYVFGVSAGRARRGIGDENDVFGLPFLLETSFGEWRLNAALGYEAVQSDRDALAYGAALAHPFGARTEILFEIYGSADTEFDDDVLNFHVGFDSEIAEDLHLLFAAGSAIRDPDGGEELDFDVFLGLQFFR
jgi:hypothetical protein